MENRIVFRQGDQYLVRIDESQLDNWDKEHLEKEKVINELHFAHGEDGHDHIIFGKSRKAYENVQVLEPAIVRHLNEEGQGDHKEFSIPAGLYKIVTERSYNIFQDQIRLARD